VGGKKSFTDEKKQWLRGKNETRRSIMSDKKILDSIQKKGERLFGGGEKPQRESTGGTPNPRHSAA